MKLIRPRRHGGIQDCLKGLLRQKLVHHENSKYDGFRLTTLGYDFLALKALLNRGAVSAIGRQIGVGKESDVFEVSILKIALCHLPETAVGPSTAGHQTYKELTDCRGLTG